MTTRGVVYIVYGTAAQQEATASIRSLRKYHRSLPVVVMGSHAVVGETFIDFPSRETTGRLAKLAIPDMVDLDEILYIDADTRIHGSLMRGFDVLHDGWDMALTVSVRQDRQAFWHCSAAERGAILAEVGPQMVQYQCGVMYFRRDAVHDFFSVWREEWQRFQTADQGAFVRAFARHPIRLWLLGRPYNEGDLIEHLYGRARS